MSRFARGSLGVLGLALLATPAVAAPPPALDEYVRRDDGKFQWTPVANEKTEAGTMHVLKLTSQVWQGITWTHQLQVYEPADVVYRDAVLLFVTGGSSTSKISREDAERGFALARLCGGRVAVLPQVPNQPLLGGKTEDELIAETFVRYLETRDANWPLLFPMVKSAVRAMDAVQQWGKKEGHEVKRFVVTGGSKRGWTTWLTGATDRRVVAIAPMVIDTLNMKAQRAHSLEVWGKFSEQIGDYTGRGLTEKYDDPVGKVLWEMVDPYSYRDRLTLPKLLINGTNDRYWTLDALNVYWDDLKGPKWVCYLPNAGHGLEVNRDYATHGIGAFFRHTISKRPMPELSWEHSDGPDGALRLTVTSNPGPKSAKLWVATAETRDFRESKWEPTPMTVNGQVVKGEAPRPSKGYVALVGDLEYEIDGIRYHLSTQVRQTGANGDKGSK
jgi:PhoPQ-activated pathogenicity-related protein